jgi:hypothetical protein
MSFAHLTIIRDLGMRPYGTKGLFKHWVRCECDCGKLVDVDLNHLRTGATKSCGHLHRTHGQSRTRLYQIWLHMWRRCYDPDSVGYENYGARGIKVFARWRSFHAFQRWALTSGYDEDAIDLTIERLDVNDDYSPENCTWIPRSRQGRNKRNNHCVTAWGETKPLQDWVEDERCRVERGTLWSRLKRGSDPESAISEPAAVQGAQKTHCVHGHEFTPENTYITKDGARGCRTCHRARDKASKKRMQDLCT